MENKECMLSCIDDFIETLQSVKVSLDQSFQYLNDKTQEEIDEIIVNKINPEINSKLSELRTTLIQSLKSMYNNILELSESLKPVVDSDPLAFNLDNLQAIIDAVMAIKNFLIKAYQSIINFMVLLSEHLVRLNNAISSVVSYSPQISFNIDKLDIKMDPITLDDIIG